MAARQGSGETCRVLAEGTGRSTSGAFTSNRPAPFRGKIVSREPGNRAIVAGCGEVCEPTGSFGRYDPLYSTYWCISDASFALFGTASDRSRDGLRQPEFPRS